MKKIVPVLLALLMCVSLFGCKTDSGDLGKQTTVDKENGYTMVQEVLSFKYNKDEDELKNNDKAVTEGFKVTADNATKIKTKSDALKVARQEVDFSYNKVQIRYDRTRGVWKITFSNDTESKDADGNTVRDTKDIGSVYVDEDGYTLAKIEY